MATEGRGRREALLSLSGGLFGSGQRPSGSTAERDEARRLLRRKLQWAKHAEHLRRDPDALLVLVAELYAELAKLRTEDATLRHAIRTRRHTLSGLIRCNSRASSTRTAEPGATGSLS